MKSPEQDIEFRIPVWESLQMLFMDTDSVDFYDEMAEVCEKSPYTTPEIEEIILNELLPALRFNLLDVASEWRGFETQWLVNRILSKNRFGKRHPCILSKYAKEQWDQLRPRIEERRESAATNAI